MEYFISAIYIWSMLILIYSNFRLNLSSSYFEMILSWQFLDIHVHTSIIEIIRFIAWFMLRRIMADICSYNNITGLSTS